MDQSQPAGDARLSSLDMRLWGLVQHVLFNWGTLVMFKEQSYIVPESMGGPRKGYVDFFVPVDSPHAIEITEFLEEELEDLRKEDWDYEGTLMPGCEVRIKVMPFSGIMPYVTRARVNEITSQFMQSFLARIEREKKKKKKKKTEGESE